MLTIGWGGVGRIDLEPAGCADPECEADHGYTGVLTSDDFSLRVSAAAEGPEAVRPARLRRRALRPHPGREPVRRPSSSRPTGPLARRPAARGRARPSASTRGCGPSGPLLPDAPAYVVFLVDGLGLRAAASDHEEPRRTCTRCWSDPLTVGVPSTTATALTSLGTALTPGTHGVVGFTSRIPGTDDLLNALMWNKHVDPREWQPHPTAFARLAAAGVTRPWSTSASSRVAG